LIKGSLFPIPPFSTLQVKENDLNNSIKARIQFIRTRTKQ